MNANPPTSAFLPGGAGYLLSGVATRLMQMFFPTALEKAQLQSVLETLALNRRRLASDEQRYENDRRD